MKNLLVSFVVSFYLVLGGEDSWKSFKWGRGDLVGFGFFVVY